MAIRETGGRNRSWGQGRVDLDDDNDVIVEGVMTAATLDNRESGGQGEEPMVVRAPTYKKPMPAHPCISLEVLLTANTIELTELIFQH